MTMRTDDFEALYRRDRDPWGYESSAYERAKYDATLAACGPGPFHRALELGASIGVLSERLAARCRRLVTIDAAPTAVAIARERLTGVTSVEIVLGTIPVDLPDGRHDLVLASEILYYLDAEALDGTLDAIRRLTAPGARVVAVHWRPTGPDRPFSAAEVHSRLREQDWLEPVERADADEYLLDALVRR